MSKSNKSKLAVALGAAFLATSVAPLASAEVNPFSATQLNSGYDLANYGDKEGSCGEGACGEGEKKGEGSCGEGSCGGGEGKKKAEGSCGEGSCGGDKKGGEGSCGEGSCGGH